MMRIGPKVAIRKGPPLDVIIGSHFSGYDRRLVVDLLKAESMKRKRLTNMLPRPIMVAELLIGLSVDTNEKIWKEDKAPPVSVFDSKDATKIVEQSLAMYVGGGASIIVQEGMYAEPGKPEEISTETSLYVKIIDFPEHYLEDEEAAHRLLKQFMRRVLNAAQDIANKLYQKEIWVLFHLDDDLAGFYVVTSNLLK